MVKPYQSRCVLGIDGLSNTEFGAEVERIQTCLENPVFLTLTPSPAEVRVVLNEFTAAQQECSGRNYKMIPTRDAKREQIAKMMRIQCDGANYISQGDETILQLSGFDLMRAPQHPSLPVTGNILKIEPANNLGSFTVTVQPTKKRLYYKVQVVDGNGVAHNYTSTKHKFVIDGFAKGSIVQLTTCTTNAAGDGPWSRIQYYEISATSVITNPALPTDGKNMKVA
jgi:hypothetical protein